METCFSTLSETDIAKHSNPESAFEKAVAEEIRRILEAEKLNGSLSDYLILLHFGLDMAVFLQRQGGVTVKFLEFKAFVGSRMGGVGFGNQKGTGVQVDLLLADQSQLNIANHFIRWLFVDGTKPIGSNRYVILDNHKAKSSAMGQVNKGKQNNLRVKTLMENPVTWNELLKEVKSFLGA